MTPVPMVRSTVNFLGMAISWIDRKMAHFDIILHFL